MGWRGWRDDVDVGAEAGEGGAVHAVDAGEGVGSAETAARTAILDDVGGNEGRKAEGA